jgi:hypothetical protein
MRKNNKVVALGMVTKKRWRLSTLFLSRSNLYKYWVKVPNVEEPLIVFYDDTWPLKEGNTITVEYNPDRPKKGKLIID